jgi:putative ABC transport system permease protein
MKYLRLVWRNLQRNRRRTILTIAAIAVAVFVYAILAALPSLFNFVLGGGASARRIITHSKSGVFYTLPEAHLHKVREVAHIDAAVAFTFFGGIYRDPWEQLGFAIDADHARDVWPDWGITDRSAAEFNRIRTAALVSPDLMRRNGWRVGEQIILRGTIYPVNASLQIVGVLGGRVPPDTLLLRRDYLNELLGGTAPVNAVWALADRTESVDGVIAAIDRLFANSAAETQSESQSSFVEAFENVKSIFTVINVLAAIVVFTIGLVAANTAAMAMRERRGEIAVMRAIGFGRSLILCSPNRSWLGCSADWSDASRPTPCRSRFPRRRSRSARSICSRFRPAWWRKVSQSRSRLGSSPELCPRSPRCARTSWRRSAPSRNGAGLRSVNASRSSAAGDPQIAAVCPSPRTMAPSILRKSSTPRAHPARRQKSPPPCTCPHRPTVPAAAAPDIHTLNKTAS